MNYDETIRYLYNLQKHGIKFGLQNINRLLSALDNPHKSFLTVHVGGTNGKGSTSAMMISPNVAKLAVTPPNVGSHKIDI